LVRPITPVQLVYFDLEGVIKGINLDELGITITERACIKYKSAKFDEVEDFCGDPSKFKFYDALHFTTAIHRKIAEGMAAALVPPEKHCWQPC